MHAWIFALVLLVALRVASAQSGEVEPRPGWLLSCTDDVGAATIAANAAFDLQPGETLVPTLPTGGGSIEYLGVVRTTRKGRYTFSVECTGGTATLVLVGAGGAPLDSGNPLAIDWKQDEIGVRVHFQRATDRPARLRTLWSLTGSAQGDFATEPIPSRLVHLPSNSPASSAAFAGRVLLETKSCTSCHAIPEKLASAVGRREAPKLDRLGTRFGRAWTERWVLDPSKIEPDTDMPRVSGTALAPGENEVRALVTWLAREGPTAPEPLANEAAVLNQGRALYHARGCVACHGALESPAVVRGNEFLPNTVPKVEVPAAFEELAGKWRPRALSAMLVDPLSIYPDGRMPSLGLNQADADLIATYLVHRFGPPPAQPAVATRLSAPAIGAVCAACHAISGYERKPASAKSLVELRPDKGCLDPKDTTTPRYELDAEERKDLRAALDDLAHATGAPAPLDLAARIIEADHCTACHVMDGHGGVPEELRSYFVSTDERTDIGDEGRLPPDLSNVGFKLTTTWLDSVLLHAGRARTYLAARMPQFGAQNLGDLAKALARREGIEPGADMHEPQSSDALVSSGRELMGRKALNCITCHNFKNEPPTGSNGPRLDQFAARLRYEWYQSYMVDPLRYKPNTRMPSFQVHGKSAVTDVLGGEFAQQSQAMWSYFTVGEFMPPPDDLLHGGGLVISVKDKPIVMRAFLPSVGARAIAVGLPVGVHFAFDAGAVRLADAWRGEFLEASGSWSGRGGEELGGSGPFVWKASAGPAFLIGDAPAFWPTKTPRELGFRFTGYELDARGFPRFLYTIGKASVREQFSATLLPKLQIHRMLEIYGLAKGDTLWWNCGTSAPKATVLTDVKGATLGAEKRAGEDRLISLSVTESKCAFSVEVSP